MSRLTLTLLENTLAIDASTLAPALLRSLSNRQIRDLPLRVGNRTCALADLFTVTGDATDTLSIECGSAGRNLNYVGAGLTDGSTLIVNGDVGSHAGCGMTGGQLQVAGDAGDYLGASALGGQIHIEGNARDFVAAALPGHRYGAGGVTIQVDGNVGHRLADRMRRGLVMIGGNVGDWPTARLIAGTVFIGGQCGIGLASGMRRGTVMVLRASAASALAQQQACFVDGGPLSPVYTTILQRSLIDAAADNPTLSAMNYRPTTRYLGDQRVAGLGELLIV